MTWMAGARRPRGGIGMGDIVAGPNLIILGDRFSLQKTLSTTNTTKLLILHKRKAQRYFQ